VIRAFTIIKVNSNFTGPILSCLKVEFKIGHLLLLFILNILIFIFFSAKQNFHIFIYLNQIQHFDENLYL